jgi:hypothetical protein
MSLEDCESRFQPCVTRVPACLDTRFPVASTGLESEPTYPEYTFSVEGYDQLYDAKSQTVAVFAEWTAAQWLGWQDLDVETTRCPFIDGQPIFIFPSPPCPAPRQLTLQVGQQTFHVNVSLHWEVLSELAAPTDVEVRIVADPSGTLVFQVRDTATGLPVVMVVESLPSAAVAAAEWEFAPFTFAAGERLCFTEPSDCRWGFSPLGLQVKTADAEQTVEPLHFATIDVGGSLFTVLHAYLFDRYDTGDHACSSPAAPRRSFALIAAKGPP